MSRWTIFPILWPILLLLGGEFHGDLRSRWHQQRQIEAQLDGRRRELESLRAKTVAGRIDSQEYQRLLDELAISTQLSASDPFRDPQARTLGSVHAASFINGLQAALADGGSEIEEGANDFAVSQSLRFLTVSPGGQQRIGPFVMIEFVLNLEGRFRDIPPFLGTLTEIGKRRKLAISIGELRLVNTDATATTGELKITLPIRAYYRE